MKIKYKGQTFMPDFLGGFLVFALLLALFLSSWNAVVGDQTEFEEETELRRQGFYTTTFLVSTPGHPDKWNSDNIQVPGFTSSEGFLQERKLKEFKEISYQNKLKLLQAPDFYLKITNGTSIISLDGEKLEYGKNYSEAETIVPFTRNVLVNDSGKTIEAKMQYVVWK